MTTWNKQIKLGNKLFKMAGLLTRKFHPRLQCVNSQTGDCISDTKSIGERWKEYCEELYMDNGDNKEVILEFTVNTQI